MKNRQTKVYILCGVHNNLKDTKKLLKAVESLNFKNTSTVIVDDGSTDGSFEFINKNYKDITVIRESGNLWWTGAIHKGVDHILAKCGSSDYILTINNDCTFDKDYIDQLLKVALKHKRAIIGSLIIDSKDKKKIIDSGVAIDWKRTGYVKMKPEKVDEIPKIREFQDKIDVLSTKGTLFPVEVFKTVGNFDKNRFPHYLSDYEFTCRAKSKEYKLLLSYKARVYNDSKRTGLGKDIPGKINLLQYFQFLFSKRSRINIIDHLRFISLCCPRKYRLKNYAFALLKSILLILFVLPIDIAKLLKRNKYFSQI